MARIMVIGATSQVELESDPIEGGVQATCVDHSHSDGRLSPPGACFWTAEYDDWNDATEYAQDHADNGRQ